MAVLLATLPLNWINVENCQGQGGGTTRTGFDILSADPANVLLVGVLLAASLLCAMGVRFVPSAAVRLGIQMVAVLDGAFCSFFLFFIGTFNVVTETSARVPMVVGVGASLVLALDALWGAAVEARSLLGPWRRKTG